MNMLQAKKYCLLIKDKNIRTSLIYIFPLRKSLGKINQKQIGVLKFLNLSNKIYELKQIEEIFPKKQLNDLIIDKLNKIMNL